MKHFKKIAIALVAILGLATVGSSVTSIANVHAMPRTFSRYWNRYRHVRARRGFRAYEIHDVTPEYKSKVVRSKWIRKDRRFYVKRRGIEWMWTLNGYGLHNHGHYVWIYNGSVNHFKH